MYSCSSYLACKTKVSIKHINTSACQSRQYADKQFFYSVLQNPKFPLLSYLKM